MVYRQGYLKLVILKLLVLEFVVIKLIVRNLESQRRKVVIGLTLETFDEECDPKEEVKKRRRELIQTLT